MQKDPSPNVVQDGLAALITFAEASDRVSQQVRAIEAAGSGALANCSLADALGRRLAVSLCADRDQPPFPRVTRDGFAVRAQDVKSNALLRVIGQIRAGEAWPPGNADVGVAEAVEIMTGAPLPPGADAVLMVEHAQETRSDLDTPDSLATASFQRFVCPLAGRTIAPGENVVPAGSEARCGDVLLQPGSRLGPEQIALAASCGFLSLPVISRPKVAILATGDELVDASFQAADLAVPPREVENPIAVHQIYDSNSYALAALVQHAGAIPLRQPPAHDSLEDLAAGIRHGLKAADLLLLTGGVSMGKFDLVEEVLAGMGAEFFFTGVRIQPGKPIVFGRVPATAEQHARYFFGLPGNPVSTMVTFRLFVEPLLAALAGERNWQPRIAMAELGADIRTKRGLTRFLPAVLDTGSQFPTVSPVHTQGSGDLAANARANCYLIVPEDCDLLCSKQMVRVLLR